MRGFCPLASGSKGNCLYLGTENTKILIDAGISCKAVQERLSSIGVALSQIDAILVTHEHGDHISGIPLLAEKMNIPVFANAETIKGVQSQWRRVPRFKIFSTGESFEFGEIEISPFSIQHDTLDPVAFTFQIDKVKIGVCADLGFVTSLVSRQLEKCDLLYIESNHEPSMVYASSRPPLYKQRVLGRQGHLSNDMCANLVAQVLHPGLKQIYLAHLSQECNHPELALQKVMEKITNQETKVQIAYQEKVSDFFVF